MSENFTIKRKFNFTQIENSIIRSKELSGNAKSLLAIFLSFSDDFKATLVYIAENFTKESLSTVKRAMAELRAAGYAKSEKIFNGKMLAGWEHTIFDSPQLPRAHIDPSPTAQYELSETATNPTAQYELSDNHYNKIPNKNNIKTKQKDLPKEPTPAELIFEHYCKVSGHRPRSSGWLDMINARLKSYSFEELMQAVSITLSNKFLCGENPENKYYATLEYIFRHDKQVDKILMRSPNTPVISLPTYTEEDFSKLTQEEFKALIIKTFPKYHIGDAIMYIRDCDVPLTRTGIWNWHLSFNSFNGIV